MSVGPVDVYIIGFPGNNFTGRIVPAIMEQVDNGTIRILDLEFVMKDADGVVTALDLEELDSETGAEFVSLEITKPGSLSSEDADEISEDLPPNSSALLIAVENIWAAKLVDALADAEAQVLDYVRIPVDVTAAVLGD